MRGLTRNPNGVGICVEFGFVFGAPSPSRRLGNLLRRFLRCSPKSATSKLRSTGALARAFATIAVRIPFSRPAPIIFFDPSPRGKDSCSAEVPVPARHRDELPGRPPAGGQRLPDRRRHGEFVLIDIGYDDTVDEIIELIRQMDFNLSTVQDDHRHPRRRRPHPGAQARPRSCSRRKIAAHPLTRRSRSRPATRS